MWEIRNKIRIETSNMSFEKLKKSMESQIKKLDLSRKVNTLKTFETKTPKMKNFDWTTFTRRIAIKATLPDIYNAWTKAVDIEKWFLSKAIFIDTNGKSISKEEQIEKGFTYEWNWYLFEVTERGKITDTNGKDFIQFTFAGECLVDIKLSTQNDYVIVELTQKNIPTDDNSKQEIRLGCDSGWSFFLVNLKSVYEGGLDLRNKDTKLKGMVNN